MAVEEERRHPVHSQTWMLDNQEVPFPMYRIGSLAEEEFMIF